MTSMNDIFMICVNFFKGGYRLGTGRLRNPFHFLLRDKFIVIQAIKMFRTTAVRAQSIFRNALTPKKAHAATVSRFMSSHSTETDEQFDTRFENFFNRKDIDGWEIRRGINDLWATIWYLNLKSLLQL
nr:unnamed protein product [Callosobruchus analis]